MSPTARDHPPPAAPGWPWHDAGSSRVHLSHGPRLLRLTCSNTRARHSPQDAVAKTGARPLPRDRRKTWPGAEDGCREGGEPALLTPPNPFAPPLHPPWADRKVALGGFSHEGMWHIPMAMKADRWGARRRHAEGRERPRAKASIIISHRAALIGALKRHRNFITLRQLQAGFSSLVPLFIKHTGRPALPGQQGTGESALLQFPGQVWVIGFCLPRCKMPAAPG